MPEPLTPAEEFRLTARIVRECARRVSAGPWVVRGIGDFGWLVAGERFSGVETADSEQGKADAEWIALVNPLIGEPLAAWFEREAKVANRRHPSDDNPALAVARLIRTQHQAMQGGEPSC